MVARGCPEALFCSDEASKNRPFFTKLGCLPARAAHTQKEGQSYWVIMMFCGISMDEDNALHGHHPITRRDHNKA